MVSVLFTRTGHFTPCTGSRSLPAIMLQLCGPCQQMLAAIVENYKPRDRSETFDEWKSNILPPKELHLTFQSFEVSLRLRCQICVLLKAEYPQLDGRPVTNEDWWAPIVWKLLWNGGTKWEVMFFHWSRENEMIPAETLRMLEFRVTDGKSSN